MGTRSSQNGGRTKYFFTRPAVFDTKTAMKGPSLRAKSDFEDFLKKF